MRFHTKVYVSDVMDHVVVSGYVLDTDPMTNPDHDVWEFAYDVPSYGLDDPQSWLAVALNAAATLMSTPPSRVRGGGGPMGVRNTVAPYGDTPE